jgi:hypothetical protein
VQPLSIEIPEDITPKAFYEELIPRVFREHHERAAQAVPAASQIRASLRSEVQGDGGGVWTISFADGVLEVKPEALPNPLVTFSQTREDWQVSITKGIGRLVAKLAAGGPMPSGPTPGAPRPTLTPQKIDLLKKARGVMNFDITQYEGTRTIRLKLAFSSAVEGKDPTCTVSLTASDYRDMTSGKLPPQQAFMSGKIRITGDMAFAMQLGTMLLMG